jgi:hypothetical protein
MHPPGPSSKEFRIADVQVFRKLTEAKTTRKPMKKFLMPGLSG